MHSMAATPVRITHANDIMLMMMQAEEEVGDKRKRDSAPQQPSAARNMLQKRAKRASPGLSATEQCTPEQGTSRVSQSDRLADVCSPPRAKCAIRRTNSKGSDSTRHASARASPPPAPVRQDTSLSRIEQQEREEAKRIQAPLTEAERLQPLSEFMGLCAPGEEAKLTADHLGNVGFNDAVPHGALLFKNLHGGAQNRVDYSDVVVEQIRASSLPEEERPFFIFCDCRFDYEFAASRIPQALRTVKPVDVLALFTLLLHMRQQNPTRRLVVLFYCEFSSLRGPRAWHYFRKLDRRLVQDRLPVEQWPNLHFPDAYVLKSGFDHWHGKQPVEPADGPMVSMHHHQFRHKLDATWREVQQAWHRVGIGGTSSIF